MTVAYVLPFALWYLGVIARNSLGESGTWIYAIQTVAIGLFLVGMRKHYRDIPFRCSPLSILVGIAVFIIWVGLYPWLPRFESTTKPCSILLGPEGWEYWTWITFRILGMAVVVPIAEELFWRGFLMRWIIQTEWTKVPMGAFTWTSFLMVTLFFGVEHSEWAAGIIAGISYGGLLVWRKNLSDCIVAHAVTNLLLGIYVATTHQWHFW